MYKIKLSILLFVKDVFSPLNVIPVEEIKAFAIELKRFLDRTPIRLSLYLPGSILEAMVNSPFKAISGKVIYYNTKDNSIFRVVEFKYAYIVFYKEIYNVDRKRQMYSTITFSADIIMIGDAYLSNQW